MAPCQTDEGASFYPSLEGDEVHTFTAFGIESVSALQAFAPDSLSLDANKRHRSAVCRHDVINRAHRMMLDIWELEKSWLASRIGWGLDSDVRLVVDKQAQIRSGWMARCEMS